MTRDEAKAILQGPECYAYVAWDSEADTPQWIDGRIIVDGDMTAAQLSAILAFAPGADAEMSKLETNLKETET